MSVISCPSSIKPWPVLPMKSKASYAHPFWNFFIPIDFAFLHTVIPALCNLILHLLPSLFLLHCCCLPSTVLPTMINAPVITSGQPINQHSFTIGDWIWSGRSIRVPVSYLYLLLNSELRATSFSSAAKQIITYLKIKAALTNVVV
jgi:hypothetical protein